MHRNEDQLKMVTLATHIEHFIGSGRKFFDKRFNNPFDQLESLRISAYYERGFSG